MKAFTAALFAVAALLPTLAVAEESLTTIAAPAPNSIVAAQWVQLDADGRVSGNVVAPSGGPAASNGQVTLIGQGGEPVTAEVEANGRFALSGVMPGVYAVSYTGDNAFAAYALHVVASEEAASLPNSTTVIASTLSPARARSTIARYQAPRVDQVARVESSSELPVTATTPGLTSYYQVGRNAEGGIDGRLIQAGSVAGGLMPAAETNVLIIQDGNVVGQAISAADGTFKVADLQPGHYNLIASGTVGFAATGFELVDTAQPLAGETRSNPFRLANANMQDPGTTLELQMAPPVDLAGEGPLAFEEVGPPVGPPMEPGFGGGGFGGGGFGGGFGGGGGGGLGGGGLGGLAALGGVAAAIAVAASDDDDDSQPREQSPAVPSFDPPGPPFNPPGPPSNIPPAGPNR